MFDPFDPAQFKLKLPKLEADVICTSHAHFDHNYVEGVKGAVEGKTPFVISAPGEYDVKGIAVRGFRTYHDDKEGKDRGLNTIYYVEFEDMFFLHLGDLGTMPSKEILEEIGDVDVLFIPVGGTYTIDYKMASEVVSEFEPSYVIPMHYSIAGTVLADKLEHVEKFISEMGEASKMPKLKISGKSDLPEETAVVVLDLS